MAPTRSGWTFSPEPLARRCARRPWLTIGLWVVLLVISLGLRAALFEDGVTAEFDFTNEPESKRGKTLLEERLRGPTGTNEVVIIQSETRTVQDPEFRDTVVSLFDDLVALGPEVIRQDTLTNFSREGGELPGLARWPYHLNPLHHGGGLQRFQRQHLGGDRGSRCSQGPQ